MIAVSAWSSKPLPNTVQKQRWGSNAKDALERNILAGHQSSRLIGAEWACTKAGTITQRLPATGTCLRVGTTSERGTL